ncbi:hypothetical protein ZBT109_1009 [Zymobacter palmae]|uniref:Uncharacterized protein n=1 Tax=Zymobacter palmae TaxID=33074 RepID=A0A348HDS4_9GAMM|nr:hypothetical protein ZBT109_1009 [Zymobacter palmae]
MPSVLNVVEGMAASAVVIVFSPVHRLYQAPGIAVDG